MALRTRDATETESTEEENDCDCEDLPDDVPCADCYIQGEAEWGN